MLQKQIQTNTETVVMDERWAQLVSTSDVASDPVIVTKDKFVIGRFKTGT